MKFLVFAMGPGESSHGYAIAQYLKGENHEVVFALQDHSFLPFYSHSPPFNLVVTSTPVALQDCVASLRPNAVLLCNSKTFNTTEFAEIRPWKTIPTFGVDSNWLFESTGPFRCIQWLDKYFVVFPASIFDLGLKKNAGHFTIPADLLPRVEPVGFVPSYTKPHEQVRMRIRQNLGVQAHEKLVFCYISGRGAAVRSYVLYNLLPAVKKLRSKGRAIKVFVVGNLDLVEKLSSYNNDWLLLQRSIIEDFYGHLASADLVFQHYGLGTLAQAISAQVPIIANVALNPTNPYPRMELKEVTPFYKADMCQVLYKYSLPQDIQDTVEALLYDEQRIHQMQEAQKKYYSTGEQKIYELMMKYLQAI
ncbi:MAG: hypothetical protein JOZ71_14900 [Ktedonobacteraceae bacterium]|nr:hypothetical protein [Ktedonobacteraceae bacterium]